jgi:glyoxylase-like metal-dependent hydrolase (beta-lactamase superfamily II)
MTAQARGVQLEVLKTAEVRIPYHYVFRAQGSRAAQLRAGLRPKAVVLESPCLAFIVRHPSLGVLLIDTGLHPDASTNLRKDFGLAMGLLFRELTPAQPPFDEQLRSAGVEPNDVERVVLTHLHVDHTSGLRLLPNASFICTRQEWSGAHRPLAFARGYVTHHLPPKAKVQLVDFETDGEPYDVFPRTIDLAGDGTIRLLHTPGHTSGHQSVHLRLNDGRTVVLVGDAAYTTRSIRDQLLPVITADDGASLDSLRRLAAFARSHPDASLVPSHDPHAWHRLASDGARAPSEGP